MVGRWARIESREGRQTLWLLSQDERSQKFPVIRGLRGWSSSSWSLVMEDVLQGLSDASGAEKIASLQRLERDQVRRVMW